MRIFARALTITGLAVAAAGAALFLAATYGQETARVEWEEQAVRPGESSSITRLSFPEQHKEFFVEDGASKRALLRGPARITWSVEPGQSGNCIIAAHRDTHFRMLMNVQADEHVVLERKGQRFLYRITALQVVRATDQSFYQPTKGAVLTLVTCYPFYYVGNAPKRFIVRAVLESVS